MDKTTWLLLSDDEKRAFFLQTMTTLVELDKEVPSTETWKKTKPLEKTAFQILDWAQE